MSFDIDIERRIGDRTINVRILSNDGIVALFGPSGVGKTTVLNMIAGLARPARGHIAIAGRYLFDAANGLDTPAHQRRSGYVFQDARLFPHMRVAANLHYGTRSAAKTDPAQFDVIVDLLGIGNLLDRWPTSLSGGEAQRVAIGRALLSQPDFLMMDEPLAALDAARRTAIIGMVRRLHDTIRIPILFVSHDRQDVAALTDTVIRLDY